MARLVIYRPLRARGSLSLRHLLEHHAIVTARADFQFTLAARTDLLSGIDLTAVIA